MLLSGVSDLTKLTNNKRDKLSKLFREYNTDMTSYSKKVLDKKEGQGKDFRLEDDEMYSTILRHSKLLRERNKNKGFKNLESSKRTSYLNDMASKPEIREVLTKMCNELIVTRENSTVFAEAKVRDLELKELGFKEKVIESINESLKINFNDFIKKLNMTRDGAWNIMYQFLKHGRKAWQIVYDNPQNPKKILHFVEMDVDTLEEIYDKGERFWIQTPKSTSDLQMGGIGLSSQMSSGVQNKTLFYDHQIIMIDWNSNLEETESTSYLEGLVKPYNMMRIMDETRIIWAVTNSTFRTMYSIPTANQGRHRAEQTVSTTMELYKDHYDFDSTSGDVTTNGRTNLQMSKDIFLSNGDTGTPEVTVLGGEGFDLQNIEPNIHFQKKFYRASGIPYARFEPNSAETWNVDPTATQREEMDFDRYKGKIREIYAKIILKPLIYQLVLDHPELHNEPDIAENIYIDFETNSLFGRMMKQEVLKAEFEFVEQIRNSLVTELASGESISMMPLEYILKEYLDYDDDKLKMIEEMRLKEIEKNLLLEKKILNIRNKYGLEEEFGEFGDEADGDGGIDF